MAFVLFGLGPNVVVRMERVVLPKHTMLAWHSTSERGAAGVPHPERPTLLFWKRGVQTIRFS